MVSLKSMASLADIAHQRPEFFDAKILHINAVDRDASFLHIPETRDEVYQSRLSASRLPDNRHCVSPGRTVRLMSRSTSRSPS